MFLAASQASESRNIPSPFPGSYFPVPLSQEHGPLLTEPGRTRITPNHKEETYGPRGLDGRDPRRKTGAPTTAGSRSTALSSAGPRWGSAAHTAPASGAAHLPAAAGPGSSPPCPFTYGEQRAEAAPLSRSDCWACPWPYYAHPCLDRGRSGQDRLLPPTDTLSCAGRKMVRRGRPPCPPTRNPLRLGEGLSKVRCPPPLPLPLPHRGFPRGGTAKN